MNRELVKPIQARHGKGWSAIYLQSGADWGMPDESVYVKQQRGYEARRAWRFFRKTPTLSSEVRALMFCSEHDIPAPEVVQFEETKKVVQLVLREISNACDLRTFLAQPHRTQDIDKVIISLANAIGKLHANKWIHGSLGNDHILVKPDLTVTLIDFEKARWYPLGIKKDLDRFWRRTACMDVRQTKLFLEHYQRNFKSTRR